uniref:Uncharacterized protein n=1 Tax=Myoviridae sp. ctshb19 TaxID=2825194 RepID=A0A8S5UGG6_9CAUD|nr:MAG TPA: hypothetical protein [Myoviridae sp. ctshb19]
MQGNQVAAIRRHKRLNQVVERQVQVLAQIPFLIEQEMRHRDLMQCSALVFGANVVIHAVGAVRIEFGCEVAVFIEQQIELVSQLGLHLFDTLHRVFTVFAILEIFGQFTQVHWAFLFGKMPMLNENVRHVRFQQRALIPSFSIKPTLNIVLCRWPLRSVV